MSILEYYFPDQIMSRETIEYNCLAWAVGDDRRRWEPDPMHLYYWPPLVPRLLTLDAVIKACEAVGFVVCNDGMPEAGFIKIAHFVDARMIPTHVARLLPIGRWTSKCGDLEDIEHDLSDVCGPPLNYGDVACYMKKPV